MTIPCPALHRRSSHCSSAKIFSSRLQNSNLLRDARIAIDLPLLVASLNQLADYQRTPLQGGKKCPAVQGFPAAADTFPRRRRRSRALAAPYGYLNRTSSLIAASHHDGEAIFRASSPRASQACAGGARDLREGSHAIDCEPSCNDQPGCCCRLCRHAGAGGRCRRQLGGRCRHRLSRWRQRHARHHGSIFPPATIPLVAQGFPADAGSVLAAGRGRGGREAHHRRDRHPAAARRAAGQSARTRQAHRGAEGRARQSAGRDRCRHRAAQIRRALCGNLAGRNRRQGRGASDRRMARGLCRGRGGSRQRRHRDPRRRTQAARHRPRDRAARSRPRGQAAEQARGPDRSRRRCRDQGDAAGDLRRAQRALAAALRCPARHRREGPQARARTGAPRRDHPDHRRGLVECRAGRFDRADRARRQRARSEFADRAISATAASAGARRRLHGYAKLPPDARAPPMALEATCSARDNAPTSSRPRPKSAASR